MTVERRSPHLPQSFTSLARSWNHMVGGHGTVYFSDSPVTIRQASDPKLLLTTRLSTFLCTTLPFSPTVPTCLRYMSNPTVPPSTVYISLPTPLQYLPPYNTNASVLDLQSLPLTTLLHSFSLPTVSSFLQCLPISTLPHFLLYTFVHRTFLQPTDAH